MFAVGLLLVRMLCDLFKPRPRLEADILILRHQLNVLQQRTPRPRLHLRWVDRALFIWLYRRYPRILDAITIVKPWKALPTAPVPTSLFPCWVQTPPLRVNTQAAPT